MSPALSKARESHAGQVTGVFEFASDWLKKQRLITDWSQQVRVLHFGKTDSDSKCTAQDE